MHAARLLRIVRAAVRAPDPVVEDACQFAWSRLMHNRERIQRDTALAWLAATAMHEAVKLVRRAGRDLSLEAVGEDGSHVALAAGRGPDAVAEARERLASLTSLTQRQQQLLWLRGLGLSYEEIARRHGCTSRAVERQLQRARTKLRVHDARTMQPPTRHGHADPARGSARQPLTC